MSDLAWKILVCCHKQDIFAKQPPFYPIQVGKAISNIDLNIPGDDTGVNISSKNSSFCELTGMYWAWKNLKDTDVIGLCHYRRYFDFYHQGRFGFPSTSFKTADFDSINLTIPDKIKKAVESGSIVVTKPRYYRFPLYYDYCECHISDDIRSLNIIIQKTQSKNIRDAFFKVFYQGNKLRHYNMFIMKWEQFNQYCSWLFPLLGQVENAIDISHYNPTQKRIFGFMAERLFNVWIVATNQRVIEKPVIWINEGYDNLGQYSLPRYVCRVACNMVSNFLMRFRKL